MAGRFLISLDLELLWGLAGWNQEQIAKYIPNVENSINVLTKILEILKEYNVKVTIGYVGAMRFSSKDDFLQFVSFKKPVYDYEPYSSYNSIVPLIDTVYNKDLFFCPNVISSLEKNELVELASHTYSHFYCLEDGVTIENFKVDLASMKKLDPKLKTIIFPRNQVNNEMLSLCKEYGFTHFRDKFDHNLYRTEKTQSRYNIKGALRLIDAYVDISGNQTFQSIDKKNGLKAIPESAFLRPYSSSLSFMEKMKVEKIKRMMTKAANTNSSYHVWWHPHNFGQNMSENLHILDQICQHYTELHRHLGFQSKFISDL